jgi:hypothetical protein
LTYQTVPITARVPEYGARAFQVKDKESSSIEAAFITKDTEMEVY